MDILSNIILNTNSPNPNNNIKTTMLNKLTRNSLRWNIILKTSNPCQITHQITKTSNKCLVTKNNNPWLITKTNIIYQIINQITQNTQLIKLELKKSSLLLKIVMAMCKKETMTFFVKEKIQIQFVNL